MGSREEIGGAAGPGCRRTLRVLGGIHLSAPGHEGGEKLGRKEHALLAFLALHAGRPQARSKLASLLWGNILEESARQDLRQALSKLRHALSDPDHSLIKSVKMGGDEAVLFDADSIEVDASKFESLSRRGDRASLEAGPELYAGDLLDGLEVRVDAFESWLGGERARLRHLAVDTLVRVSKLRSDAGENQAAIDSLHSALRLDPVREDACRQLMQIYASIGRRTAALQEYSALEDHLRRELQTGPEPETTALAESIRHGSVAAHKEIPPKPVVVTPSAKTAEEPKARVRHRRRRIVITVTVVLLGALIVLLPAIVYWRIPELAPQPIG